MVTNNIDKLRMLHKVIPSKPNRGYIQGSIAFKSDYSSESYGDTARYSEYWITKGLKPILERLAREYIGNTRVQPEREVELTKMTNVNLEDYREEILRREAEKMNSLIEVNREIKGGAPVFAGTRIPVSIVLSHLAVGESVEAILEGYPKLNSEHINIALRYAAQVLDGDELDD